MTTLEDRISSPISTGELNRRWSAVRESMARAGVDALLLQNTNDFLGGYIKWFTDIPATTGYPTTVIFPQDAPMTLISQGTFGLDKKIDPAGTLQYRGVERLMGAPGYASARYTAQYELDAAATALQAYATSTIGLVGSSHTAMLLDHLRATFPKAKFVDASDLVDTIKAVKSDEEVALIRQAAMMQDACMAAVAEIIRPGMRDIEVGAVAERIGRSLGSEQGIFLCASGPVGTAAVYGIRHFQNRIIQNGDVFHILIENSGPGGMYTEIGRSFVFGRAATEMKDEFAFVRDAQHFTAELLAQGLSCAEIWERYNARMREHKRPEETRLYCHGQGYDLVERPLVRFDEKLSPSAAMNFACHPTIVSATHFTSCCDNFLIHEGKAERLHTYAQEIIEIV